MEKNNAGKSDGRIAAAAAMLTENPQSDDHVWIKEEAGADKEHLSKQQRGCWR